MAPKLLVSAPKHLYEDFLNIEKSNGGISGNAPEMVGHCLGSLGGGYIARIARIFNP